MGKRGRTHPSRNNDKPDSKDTQDNATVKLKQVRIGLVRIDHKYEDEDEKLNSAVKVVISKEDKRLADIALREGKYRVKSSKNSSSDKRASTTDRELRERSKGASKNLSERTNNLGTRRLRDRRRVSPIKSRSLTLSRSPTSTRTRRKALVKAISTLRKQSSHKRNIHKAQNPKHIPVKRILRTTKSNLTSSKSAPALRPEKRKIQDISQEEVSRKLRSSAASTSKMNKSPANEDNISTAPPTSNESSPVTSAPNNGGRSSRIVDSDDDRQMQVLEKQVPSDNSDDESDENLDLNQQLLDEDSDLLSPSALPASALFQAPRRKKRSESETRPEQPAPIPHSSSQLNPSRSLSLKSNAISSLPSSTPSYQWATTGSPSSVSSSPEKRGRGRPRKPIEDVKTAFYRKKLEDSRVTLAGVGRGKPIYSSFQSQTTAVPSTSFQPERTPYDYDENFDEDPIAASISDEHWQNRSTFNHAKPKVGSAKDSEAEQPRGKLICDVCNVEFTALSSLKRHYGTIYHKQKEQNERRSSANRNGFQPSDQIPSTSTSPSLRRGRGQSTSILPRTSSVIRRNAAANLKKHYAAKDAARRRREGVDGSGGTWIQKQQRTRKPLQHSDYIYQSSLSRSTMDDDDDDDQELGLIRDEDIENTSPSEDDDLMKEEDRTTVTPWLSNVWKGVGAPHFTCEVCEETFANKFEFTRHLFKHRQDEELQAKKSTCPDCLIRTPNEHILKQHFQLFGHGTGSVESQSVKRFLCLKCGSAFSRLEYYKKHRETHKRPPLNCPHCPKKFEHKFYLQDHIKLLHEFTNHNGNGSVAGEEMFDHLSPGYAGNAATVSLAMNPVVQSPQSKTEYYPTDYIPIENRRKSLTCTSQNPQNRPSSLALGNSKKRSVRGPMKVEFSEDNLSRSTDDVEDTFTGNQVELPERALSPLSTPVECERIFRKYFPDEDGGMVTSSERGGETGMQLDEQGTSKGKGITYLFDRTDLEVGRGGNPEENVLSMTFGIPAREVGEKQDGGQGECSSQVVGESGIERRLEIASPAESSQPSSQTSSVSSSIGSTELIGCGAKPNLPEKPLQSPLVCQDCGKTFEHRKSLVKHVRYYNQSEDFHCTICGKGFRLKHHVSRHMKSFHNVDTSSTSGAEDQTEMDNLGSPSGSNSGGLYTPAEKVFGSGLINFEGKIASAKRSVGGATPTTKQTPAKVRKRLESSPAAPGSSGEPSAITGVRRKSSSITSEPGSVSSTEDLFSPIEVADGGKGHLLKCRICKRVYPTKHLFNNHMKHDHTQQIYKCGECSQEFKFKHELTAHELVHGLGETKYLCAKCPAKPNFPNRKDLLKHTKEKHTLQGKAKPQGGDSRELKIDSKDMTQLSRCIFCPLVFPSEIELKTHMNNEHLQPILCKMCGIVLPGKDQLIEHMEQEHPEPEEDDDDTPPTPSPHTSPLHIPTFNNDEDDEEEEDEDDDEEEDTQEGVESDFELLEVN